MDNKEEIATPNDSKASLKDQIGASMTPEESEAFTDHMYEELEKKRNNMKFSQQEDGYVNNVEDSFNKLSETDEEFKKIVSGLKEAATTSQGAQGLYTALTRAKNPAEDLYSLAKSGGLEAMISGSDFIESIINYGMFKGGNVKDVQKPIDETDEDNIGMKEADAGMGGDTSELPIDVDKDTAESLRMIARMRGSR